MRADHGSDPGGGRLRADPQGGVALERGFFARPAPVVARDLVGRLLVRRDEGLLARIVETEAYTQDDPACHGYQRRTTRNAPLYGPPGHAYVYRSYGIHWCLNTVTGVEGVASGVLIRAAEPVEGLDVMAARRSVTRERDLLRGPAKLTVAFAVDGSFSGRDVCGPEAVLSYADDGTRPEVRVGPRVGVSAAADRPWRFFAASSPYVSAYRRSPRAPAVEPPR
jgi:DNA-3-methyladenine glycosylase